jgi:autotransporter-associated beta strand protein
VTKTGLGALALNAPGGSSYTGNTNVNAGLLLANNTSGSATGGGPVNINAGGILGGSGTVGNLSAPAQVNINSGGIITAGSGITPNDSTRLLTANGGDPTATPTPTYSMVMAAGGKYSWKVNAAASTTSAATQVNGVGTTEVQTVSTPAGSNWDTLAMNSLSVTPTGGSNFAIDLIPLAGSTFNNANSYTWTIADVTTGVVSVGGAAPVTYNATNPSFGNSAASAANALTTAIASHFTLNVPPEMAPAAGSGYGVAAIPDGANGDDIVISYAPAPAPEPTSLMMLGLGAVGLLLRRRRRTTGRRLHPMDSLELV